LVRNVPASLWYRAHLRQATVLGTLLTLVLLAILTIPLVIVLALGSDPVVTIRIYAVAIVVDILAFGTAAVLAVGAAVRAARGDSFRLPLVARLAERWFRLRE
jgi:uncharacterized membrane protein